MVWCWFQPPLYGWMFNHFLCSKVIIGTLSFMLIMNLVIDLDVSVYVNDREVGQGGCPIRLVFSLGDRPFASFKVYSPKTECQKLIGNLATLLDQPP